jgi:hypothetical protein
MKLTKQQFLQIQRALLDGYDRGGLRRMVRLGLGTALEEITVGATDADAVFDLVAWAERRDTVPALIEAAAEHNPQNGALQQLRRDAAAWFAPGGEGVAGAGQSGAGAQAPPASAGQAGAGAQAPPASAAPPGVGGDNIVVNVGSGAENIAAGKNVRQKVDGGERRKKE